MSLDLWTVYHRPSDLPGVEYAARKWVVDAFAQPTTEVMTEDRLDNLRDRLEAKGLTCIQRSETDDPCIVETWL